MNYDRELSLMLASFRQTDDTTVVVHEYATGFLVRVMDDSTCAYIGDAVRFDDALTAVAYAKEIS